MAEKVTVGTTAVKLDFGPADRPVIQNLGSGDLYFGPTSAVTANSGIKLSVGMGYEFPNVLKNIAGWPEVWVIASAAGTDVRVANVG